MFYVESRLKWRISSLKNLWTFLNWRLTILVFPEPPQVGYWDCGRAPSQWQSTQRFTWTLAADACWNEVVLQEVFSKGLSDQLGSTCKSPVPGNLSSGQITDYRNDSRNVPSGPRERLSLPNVLHPQGPVAQLLSVYPVNQHKILPNLWGRNRFKPD